MKKIAWNKITLTIAALALIWSCGKDDGPTPPSNKAPIIENQGFNAPETIADTETIGTVQASDPDGDDLTFSITENSSALFEITDAGALSLQAGKSLDFDVAPSHTITVAVTDGTAESTAKITISVGDQNSAPVFGEASYAFEKDESISAVAIIGKVEATDVDGDDLAYSISANDNGLFEINNAGEISLMSGKELDFETATEHVITVSVTDGTETTEVEVTITVMDVAEAHPDDKAAFVTTWQTDADGETIYIGLSTSFNYDFTINWGDGTVEELNFDNTHYIEHIYETAGEYNVAIIGNFPLIRIDQIGIFDVQTDPAPKDGYGLIGIEQWGTIQWQSMNGAFYGASSLESYSATDAPDLSQVTDMSSMFQDATEFNGDLSGWDTSSVTSMESMFRGASLFNGDLSNWDTSSVTSMAAMFGEATAFNGDLNGWDTSSVENMYAMFFGATSFNADISNWNTENVILMEAMFADATSFNRDISGWKTGSLKGARGMFLNATSFNQNLGSWDIGSLDPDFDAMNQMLDNSGMSPQNFSATLIGWEAADNTPSDITLGAVGVKLCSEPESTDAFQSLIDENTYNWSITLTGFVQCN